MFRRKAEAPVEPVVLAKPGGKGRPTPSRKEAEAAAKARNKAPRTRAELARSRGAAAREGLRSGDERYLLARDRGPVRRFIRDWVDSRFLVAEIILPVVIFALVIGFLGNPSLVAFGQILTLVVLLVVVVNWVFLRISLHRELAKRFPEQSTRGATYYAVMRSMMLRPLRTPKPQVKIGQELPQHYR